MRTRTRVICALIAPLSANAVLAKTAPASPGSTSAKLAAMEKQLSALRGQVRKMKRAGGGTWLDRQRAKDIQAIVENVMHDARRRQQYLSNTLQAGYDNGFYISSANKAFELVTNGYLQFRYTFASDRVQNPGIYGAHVPKSGNVNGFGFRRARLILSGHAFTPDLTFSISGDFGGTFSNHGNFQILDTFMAYKFTNAINARVGSFIVPFSYVEYVSAGLEFPDFPIDENPFDPVP